MTTTPHQDWEKEFDKEFSATTYLDGVAKENIKSWIRAKLSFTLERAAEELRKLPKEVTAEDHDISYVNGFDRAFFKALSIIRSLQSN